ncbi:hypothetical protein M0655_05295 [Gordonia amicalis]|uniref:hypothetical protein n=1 Tax=Gordonia amicalis TaxID=89053 RepID=UPI00200B7495|nr:hypothetical protein [Gordonia amicalis]UPW15010.1 hypothetical protein M0655_05295 [Gordonia amicalis]
MNLDLQAQCDAIVEQFYEEFLELRQDVNSTVKQVAQLWEPNFSDPTTMHGMLHCTSVRGLLLLTRVGGPCNPDEDPPPGVLHTRYGQGMSVVLLDGYGMRIRVRKAPAEFLPEQCERLVIKPAKAQRAKAQALREKTAAESAAEGPEQPTLSPEMDKLPRTAAGEYEWFVLWTLSMDGLQVPEVFLAAVKDIDSPSEVVILASTPLPRKARPTVVVDTSDDDFEEYRHKQGDTGTGSAPA